MTNNITASRAGARLEAISHCAAQTSSGHLAAAPGTLIFTCSWAAHLRTRLSARPCARCERHLCVATGSCWGSNAFARRACRIDNRANFWRRIGASRLRLLVGLRPSRRTIAFTPRHADQTILRVRWTPEQRTGRSINSCQSIARRWDHRAVDGCAPVRLGKPLRLYRSLFL